MPLSTDSTPPISATLKWNKNRGLWIPLGVVGACVMFLLGAGWKANEFLTSIQLEISASRHAVESLRAEVRATTVHRWTPGDMERWAYQLERDNRELKIVVPDTRQILRDRSNNGG